MESTTVFTLKNNNQSIAEIENNFSLCSLLKLSKSGEPSCFSFESQAILWDTHPAIR
jgi:hypothetical protein